MSSKVDFEKFNGSNDFSLWKIKMQAILVQQNLILALDGVDALPDSWTKYHKEEVMQKAHSAVILSLGDDVLREVCKEKTVSGVWKRLDSLYMTKSIPNRLYAKQRLYSYKMDESRGVLEQLSEFHKIVQDLENIEEERLKDEDKAVILLNALPSEYDYFQDTMVYGREHQLTLEEVESSIRSKEQKKRHGVVSNPSQGEGLNIKGKKKQEKFNKKKDFSNKDANTSQNSSTTEDRKSTRLNSSHAQ